MQKKINWGTKYHCEKSLNLFLKLKKMKTSDNLLLKIIKNCYYQKKCENKLQAWKPIQKCKNYTNILFPNCNAIIYLCIIVPKI